MKNNFNFIVPAEIYKSDDGEWRVKGLASTESVDQQGETLIQKGIDLSPIDSKKGILNWDHGRGPENTVGLLDGYLRTPKGLIVEGRLFKNHSKAKAIREIMQSLGEQDRGRMGMSVEGSIIERDPQNPKIVKKCRINAVALTLSPVNTDTFADLVKSMNTAEEIEFDSEETTSIENQQDEPTFTSSQVMAIVQKALGVGAGYTQAPDSRTGGDALAQESMDSKKKKKKDEPEVQGATEEYEPKKLKKMAKSEFAKSLVTVLDKLQVLYPDYSRSEIWEAVKDRLTTQFPSIEKGFRLKQTSAKEREHKLYEEARQRDDYEENKDKNRTELAQVARESGAEAKERAKIRAQADAAKQVGDREHVRPGVKG